MKSLRQGRRRFRWIFAFHAAVSLSAGAAHAVPSFAVQTGQPCAACHVGGFGPQLTPFGRDFKLGGYTSRTKSFNLPFSAMAVASYVRTQRDQPTPPTPDYGVNNNLTLDQASLFLAGGLGSHVGAFVQTTYDGVARGFHWDNLDVRATTRATVGKTKVLFGLSLNNAPTVQDVFNTVPAWSFPYTSSSLAPTPSAAPLIGALAQNTLGLTAYAWINSELYIEAGGYRSPSAGFLTHAGVDAYSPGNIKDIAPYARVAFDKNLGDHNFEIGLFALDANLYPGRDQSTGFTDHYTDLGLDASYQLFAAHRSVFTLNGRYTHERQNLAASMALGGATSRSQTLQDVRLDASYYWHDQIGFTVGGFDTWGTSDALLYAGNRTLRPGGSGVIVQIDGTPFGAAGSPLGPRFNMRVGIQYTDYFGFDGASSNYDGTGRSARDNNTFRAFTWLAY